MPSLASPFMTTVGICVCTERLTSGCYLAAFHRKRLFFQLRPSRFASDRMGEIVAPPAYLLWYSLCCGALACVYWWTFSVERFHEHLLHQVVVASACPNTLPTSALEPVARIALVTASGVCPSFTPALSSTHSTIRCFTNEPVGVWFANPGPEVTHDELRNSNLLARNEFAVDGEMLSASHRVVEMTVFFLNDSKRPLCAHPAPDRALCFLPAESVASDWKVVSRGLRAAVGDRESSALEQSARCHVAMEVSRLISVLESHSQVPMPSVWKSEIEALQEAVNAGRWQEAVSISEQLGKSPLLLPQIELPELQRFAAMAPLFVPMVVSVVVDIIRFLRRRKLKAA